MTETKTMYRIPPLANPIIVDIAHDITQLSHVSIRHSLAVRLATLIDSCSTPPNGRAPCGVYELLEALQRDVRGQLWIDQEKNAKIAKYMEDIRCETCKGSGQTVGYDEQIYPCDTCDGHGTREECGTLKGD